MRYVPIFERKSICENADSPFRYFAWPSVTRLPDGTLAAVASGFRLAHICPFGKGVIVYSHDEGQSWSPPAVALDTPLDDRDCGIVSFGNGRVMLTSFNNTPAFQRKINADRKRGLRENERENALLIDAYLDVVETRGGWESYLGSTYRISEDGGYTFGPLQIAPVSAPHGPCPLPDGGLLYIGRRFSADDSFDTGETPYVQCWRLDEKTDTFEYVSSIENVADENGSLLSCEPHAIALPDGKILVQIRVQRDGTPAKFTLYQCESTDGGRHFTKPRQILSDQGGAPAHLMLHSSGALICVYGYRQAPYGIRAMISWDGGESWLYDYVLTNNAQNGDLGYPATVELSNGRLLTVFYENAPTHTGIEQIIWQLPDE